MKITVILLGLLCLLGPAAPHAEESGGERLTLASARVSSLARRAVGVRYAGVEVSAGDVCLHAEGLDFGGRTFNWSDAQTDGLFVEDKLRAAAKVYQPYGLALKAGWYKGVGEPEPHNNIWGLFVSGGKIWMGTDGLGVLAFDPGREEWTRYDWQTGAAPGVRANLAFIDGKHMFVNRRGGLFAYSLKEGVGIELPLAGYGGGEVELRDEHTYVIEFAARGRGRKSYVVGVTQLEDYFSQAAAVRRRRT